MKKSKNSLKKTISQFGKKNIVSLFIAVVAGAALLSNLGLNLDPRSQAAPPSDQEACEAAGCINNRQEWRWVNGACKKRVNKSCATGGTGGSSKSAACPGTCESVSSCSQLGLANTSGSCNKKDTVCCSRPYVPTAGSGSQTTTNQQNIPPEPEVGGGSGASGTNAPVNQCPYGVRYCNGNNVAVCNRDTGSIQTITCPAGCDTSTNFCKPNKCPRGTTYCLNSTTVQTCVASTGRTNNFVCDGPYTSCDSATNWCK
jgi:hypothetical protein